MAKKWMDVAKKTLEPDDEVQQAYNGKDQFGQDGYVVLSNRKLLFLTGKGIFSKTYELTLEVPYGEVDEIIRTGNTLTLVKGEKRHILSSGYAGKIEESIKDFKESMLTTVH